MAVVALVVSACSGAPEPSSTQVRATGVSPARPQAAALPAVQALPPPPSPSVTWPRTALLVGIDRALGTSRLHGAVADVETLKTALLAYGFPPEGIVTLVDGDATRDRILSSVAKLAARTPPDGRAVFAFAGHTRRIGGANHVLAGDGRTIPASQLAGALSQVRAPTWVALPTCYAGGFALPGIVGPDRITTFASPADRPSFESLAFGRSFLFEYMVGRAMLDGRASASVEQAFAFAEAGLERDFPRHVPLMDDRHDGSFVLGPPIPPAPPDDQQPGGTSSRRSPAPSPESREPGPDDDGEGPDGLVCGANLPVGGCSRD